MKENLKHIKYSGFKAPKGYFDSLEDQISDTIKLNDILTQKDTGFKIPENYLDNIEDSIITSLNTNKKQDVISIFNKKNLVYLSGVAATLLILISIYVTKQNVTFENIELDLVENYLSTQDISSDEMLTLLSDDILIEDEFIQNNLNDEYIEDFILNEASIDDLYDQ